jgi:hypothetical protein
MASSDLYINILLSYANEFRVVELVILIALAKKEVPSWYRAMIGKSMDADVMVVVVQFSKSTDL